jgi:Fe-S cluster assembly ATP-binding protein
MSTLEIRDLHVTVGEREIVKGLSLTLDAGTVAAIMGPNGCGKSTLANAIAGRPGYQITGGSVMINGESLLELPSDERARHGLFLALQQPLDVPGVRPLDMLTAAGATGDVASVMNVEAQRLGLRPELLQRFVNVDLSGGERKRAEIVQLAALRPAVAILDEIDSGLDVDALGAVARRVHEATREWNCAVLAITHFRRLLNELTPDIVYVMTDGAIVASGGMELVDELEANGYEKFRTR